MRRRPHIARRPRATDHLPRIPCQESLWAGVDQRGRVLRRSRTNTWRSPSRARGARLVASEAKATNRPSAEIDGFVTKLRYPRRHRSRWRDSPAPSGPAPRHAHTPAIPTRPAFGRSHSTATNRPSLGHGIEVRRQRVGRTDPADPSRIPRRRPTRQTPPTTPPTTQPFPHTPPAARGRRGSNASRRSSPSTPASASVASRTRPADAGTGAESSNSVLPRSHWPSAPLAQGRRSGLAVVAPRERGPVEGQRLGVDLVALVEQRVGAVGGFVDDLARRWSVAAGTRSRPPSR